MKKLSFLTLFAAALLCFASTQAAAAKTLNVVQTAPKDSVYDMPEVLPQYPGGMSDMFSFISMNVQYPKDLVKKKVSGKVVVNFIVLKDGSISNVEVMKSVHPKLDKEAVRVVKLMPKWTPGKQDGKPVNVRLTLPIYFSIK